MVTKRRTRPKKSLLLLVSVNYMTASINIIHCNQGMQRLIFATIIKNIVFLMKLDCSQDLTS